MFSLFFVWCFLLFQYKTCQIWVSFASALNWLQQILKTSWQARREAVSKSHRFMHGQWESVKKLNCSTGYDIVKPLNAHLYSLAGCFVQYLGGGWAVHLIGDRLVTMLSSPSLGTGSLSCSTSQSAQGVLHSPHLSQPSHCFSAVTARWIECQA